MRRLFWAIALAASLIYGHPARDGTYHKRQDDPAASLSSSSSPLHPLFSSSMSVSSSISSSFSSSLSSTPSSSSFPASSFPASSSSGSSSSDSGTLSLSSSLGSPSSDSSPTYSVFSSSSSDLLSGSSLSDSFAISSSAVPSSTPSGLTATITGSSSVGISASGSVSSVSSSPSSTFASISSLSSLASSSGSSSDGAIGVTTSDPASATTSLSKDGGSATSRQLSAAATITAPPDLSIISILSLSTEATSIEGVKSNTRITTDHDGHHTVVPFLFGCWFCPHSGGGGLLLWGVGPGPGIYPPPIPPPIPKWPTITIGKDNIPTPAPEGDGDPESQNEPSKSEPSKSEASDRSTKSSASSSSSSSSSSAPCSGTTVTDYWVSCASGSAGTSSCSTYSSSLASGCSVSATTSVAVASCALRGPADDYSLSPEETAGPEHDFVDPVKYFSDFPPESTLASSSASPGSLPSSTPRQTGSRSSSTSSTGATASITFSGTPSSSSAKASHSSSAPDGNGHPLCTPFEDPGNNDQRHCQCSSGSFTTTTPFLTSTNNPCGYTSLTIPPPITTASTKTTDGHPFPFTTTDEAGNIIACASSSLTYLDAGVKLTYTRCDGSSTTVSTAKPSPTPPPEPPKPTADCSFWDEAWGWKFEVYNINGWSTEGGPKLHKEEKGCGALAGWSYNQKSSGGDAYFNLPFFIKDGCVERAIVSAGGLKIKCHGHGLGKRTLADKRTLETIAETAAPNFDDKGILDAYDPPGVNISQIEHSYQPSNWQHRRRFRLEHRAAPPHFDDKAIADAYNPPGVDLSAIKHEYTPAQWNRVKRSQLLKRGCFPSKPKPPKPSAPGAPAPITAPQAPAIQCDPILPGVDECNTQVVAKGNVGAKRSLFYTGWGANGVPGAGAIMARKWANKNLCEEYVLWSSLVDGEWKVAVQEAVLEAFRRPDMTSDELFALNEKFDPFLKNLSQAFAEKSKGDVYVFIPKGELPNNQWRMDSAWGGWEYPALTRNMEVTRILRVDLDVTNYENPTGTPMEIWKQGDAVAGYDPKGSRGPTLPEELPSDKIPAGWNGGTTGT